MSLTVKRPTIEGMPSPAVRGASGQDGAAAPAMRLNVMRSLRKHPRLAAGVGGTVFLLAFLFGLLRKPAYMAESLIYIEPLASKVLSDGTSGSYDAGRYDSYFQQQTQTALRPDILAAAIEKLPPFVWQRGGESMQSAVTRLQNSLKVQRVLTSYQLSISLVYASPQAAAAVVNAVTNSYLEQGRKDEHAVIDQRLQLLGEERQRIQQQLGEDRVEQASLGGALGLADPSSKTASPFDAQIAGVQTQVAGAREARDVAAAQYAAVAGASSPALTAAAEEQIATDAGLNSMKQTISQRKALLSTQMAGLTPSNPIYKQDQDEIADLDRSLDAMTTEVREKAERRLQDKLRADLQRTADIEGRLNAQLRHQTATATSAAPKLQRAQELNSDIERLTARFTVVDDAMRSLELESNGPGSAHLSVPAVVPVSPEPSKRKLILALSLPLGLFAGLFAAVFANRMDPRIYSAPDVEQVLGFSPIGVLPARSEVSGRTMEEYTLRLAAGLQSAYRTSSAQSFVFTAASATMQTGEFVQAIAQILGTLGFKALVMDASSVLNAANRTQAGGTRGGSSYRSAALVRTIEGTRQGFAAEELERLKLKYDLLLIDAPPLLTSAETEYLVRCADATILVAESGTTVKTELYQSALLLQHLNVAGVGAVLQELRLKDAEPAFRAAIEAVERIQQGRVDRLEQAARPEVAVAEVTADEVQGAEPATEFEPEFKRASALDRMEDTVEAEAVTLPAVAAPVVEVPHVEPEPAESPAAAESESVTEHDPVEELDQVRPWRELLKKTPEPVEEPEPVVPPVTPTAHRGDESEPVIYFQDRMRPRRAVEPAAVSTPKTQEPETIHVERAAMRVESVQHVAEPVAMVDEPETYPEPIVMTPVRVEEAEPVASQVAATPSEPALETPEQVEHPAAAVEEPAAAETFERTMFESGTEGHGQLAAEPEAVEPVAGPEVAAPESLMEAYLEKVDALPEGSAEAEVEDAPQELEAVAPVAAPAVRREPAAPKMGWFTLKFRGTSERVLRIIPGEEGDESEPVEESAVAQSEPQGAPFEAIAAKKTAAETIEPESLTEGGHASGVTFVEESSTAHAEDIHAAVGAEMEPHEATATTAPAVEDEVPRSVEQTLVSEEEEKPFEAIDEPEVEAVRGHDGETFADGDVHERAIHAEEYEASQAAEKVSAVSVEELTQTVPQVDEALAEPAEDEVEEPAAAYAEQHGDVVHRGAEVEQEPVAAYAPVQAERVAVGVHTPVKLRWTVRDVHHDELERELNGDHEVMPVAAATDAPPPAAATLIGELRSRAAAMPAHDEAGVQKHPSGRRSGAPVEERLEPRAASLTRRWEMLSRFDAPSAAREADAETPKAGS